MSGLSTNSGVSEGVNGQAGITSVAAASVGFDPTGFIHVSANNVQTALLQLDTAVGAGGGGGTINPAGMVVVSASTLQNVVQQIDDYFRFGNFDNRIAIMLNHYLGAATNGAFSNSVSGTGANASTQINDATINTDANGVLSMSTGTTSAGAAARQSANNGLITFLTFSETNKTSSVITRFKLPALPVSGAENYQFHLGFVDNPNLLGSDPRSNFQSLLMYYDSDSPGVFELTKRVGTTFTRISGTVSANINTWYKAEVRYLGNPNLASMRGQLLINDVTAAETTGLFSAACYCHAAQIMKLNRSAASLAYLDYEILYCDKGA